MIYFGSVRVMAFHSSTNFIEDATVKGCEIAALLRDDE
jgi:hypothetical protein